MYNENTENILKHDSLYESEKQFGNKHWSQFNELEQAMSMLNFMEDNRNKANHLKSIGDTYWQIPWNDFIKVIELYGFKRAWSQIFIDTDQLKSTKQEEEIIYYHKEKGLILWAESYTLCNEKHINSGDVFAIADIEGIKEWWKYSEGSHGMKDEYLHMQFDIREGIIHKIEKVSNLNLINKWNSKQNWLHFVNFMESKEIYKDKNCDWRVTSKMRDEITQNKINQCCDEFKEIINNISYLL